MRKNIVKATLYSALGLLGVLASMITIMLMYLSGEFLPVYVQNTYVIGNKIVRMELYIVLAVIFILSVKLAAYGIRFLTKKFHKILRRR